MSFELLYLRFIDLCRFFNSLVESLVDSLLKSGNESFDKFSHTHLHFGSNESLFAKGNLHYEYFDSLSKFNEIALPPKQAFYSNLTISDISDDDYLRTHKIWQTFGCKTSKDYHDFYMQCDILLLTKFLRIFAR